MDNSRNIYLEEIASLEDTINSAIELINRYENENIALKQKMKSLIFEKSVLLQKIDQAKSRLESMISRLKSLEKKSA
ncbi:MAG: TIGR02449 family protein [Alcanivoracaceae bacterium]|nr:TIGR02449 family protein [Alcanivoracaceae bacterium]